MAVLLQVVQVGWSCLVSCPHQAHTHLQLTPSSNFSVRCSTTVRVVPVFLTVCYILIECSYFAQTRKEIFGKRHVMESWFYPKIVLSWYSIYPLNNSGWRGHPPLQQRHPTTTCQKIISILAKIVSCVFPKKILSVWCRFLRLAQGTKNWSNCDLFLFFHLFPQWSIPFRICICCLLLYSSFKYVYLTSSNPCGFSCSDVSKHSFSYSKLTHNDFLWLWSLVHIILPQLNALSSMGTRNWSRYFHWPNSLGHWYMQVSTSRRECLGCAMVNVSRSQDNRFLVNDAPSTHYKPHYLP